MKRSDSIPQESRLDKIGRMSPRKMLLGIAFVFLGPACLEADAGRNLAETIERWGRLQVDSISKKDHGVSSQAKDWGTGMPNEQTRTEVI